VVAAVHQHYDASLQLTRFHNRPTMRALEILRNGRRLAVAGIEDAALLSFSISVNVDSEHPGTLAICEA
jgi:hypothetical protein